MDPINPRPCGRRSPAAPCRIASGVLAALVCTAALIGAGVVAAPAAEGQAIQFVHWQSLTGVDLSNGCWGDFDGDGDLDLVISGLGDSGRLTHTYENVGGLLVTHQTDLPGIVNESSNCLAWGDYDGDGDLDLAMAGMSDTGRIARVYENDGNGHLTWDMGQVLAGVEVASVAWGDVDNDGDLDLVVKGSDGPAHGLSTLYRNDPTGTLTPDASTSLLGLYSGAAEWADWDGDGDVDLLLTGSAGTTRHTVFYKNDPVGTLTNDGNHGLPGLYLSDAAWGDYDADGDLDLAVTGETAFAGPVTTRIYRNGGTGDMTLAADLWSCYRSSCAWGDYDNDGDLDAAICGYNGVRKDTIIYEKTGGGFVEAFTFFPEVDDGSLSWADVDQDGALDFFVTGRTWSQSFAALFRNEGGPANRPPSAPTALSCELSPGAVRLSWAGASDPETPAAGLYYCLRVGSAPGAHDIVSGTYGTPLMGNVGQMTELTLNVAGSDYYWSARAIDSGFMPSPWSPEQVCGTTPVELASFDVEMVGGAVRVAWRTATERNLFGFNVLRAEGAAAARFEQVNGELIHCDESGEAGGSTYEFVDDTVVTGRTYRYRLEALDRSGEVQLFDLSTLAVTSSGASELLVLRQNRPNPFNPKTVIEFTLPEPAHVRLRIHDAAGRAVRALVDADLGRDLHAVEWDGRDEQGRVVGSGVYHCRVEVGGRTLSTKLVLLE